jgi:hypothetical protein
MGLLKKPVDWGHSEAEIEQAIFLFTLGILMYDSGFHEMMDDKDHADTLYAIAHLTTVYYLSTAF